MFRGVARLLLGARGATLKISRGPADALHAGGRTCADLVVPDKVHTLSRAPHLARCTGFSTHHRVTSPATRVPTAAAIRPSRIAPSECAQSGKKSAHPETVKWPLGNPTTQLHNLRPWENKSQQHGPVELQRGRSHELQGTSSESAPKPRTTKTPSRKAKNAGRVPLGP